MHQLPEMNADVYVELRRDGTGKPDSYDAAEIGLYNKKTKQRLIRVLADEELSDREYRRFKINGTNLNSEWFIWVTPYANDSIKNIWVDRIILVEKK